MSEYFESTDRVPDLSAYEGPRKRELDYADVQGGEQTGTGGFARASLVTVDDRELVIKEPFVEGTIETDTFEAFVDEGETWAKLDDHPHIVNVVDRGTRYPWIAIEYMDGGSLADRLDNGSLNTTEALWIGTRLSRAVQHAHRHGVAHLDLTPSNVLFRATNDKTWDVPKISDWGMSRALLEQSGTVEGLTPNYAAPEQFDPDEFGAPDDFTDRFQLGAVVYETLTGERAFPGSGAAAMRRILDGDVTAPTTIDPNLPTDLDEVFERALAPEKSDRYETVVNFRRDLAAALDGLVSDSEESGDASHCLSGVTATSTEPDSLNEPRSSDDDSDSSDPVVATVLHRPVALDESVAEIDGADNSTVDRLLEIVSVENNGERADGPLRLAVDETFTHDGELRVVVHVASGTLSDGADLEFQPSGATMRVASFEQYLTGDSIDVAEPDDTITLVPDSVTNGDEIERGDFGSYSNDGPSPVESVDARLYVLDHPSVITAGYMPVLHAHTAQVAASIAKLDCRLVTTDDGTWDIEQSPDYAEPGDLVDVSLSPQGSLALDSVTNSPETGVFTVRDAGQTIALGIVTDVDPSVFS